MSILADSKIKVIILKTKILKKMPINFNTKLIQLGYRHVELGNFPEAIKIFYKILKSNPDGESEIGALIGLGDALRAEYEIEIAGKIYNRALIRAENLENTELIHILDPSLNVIKDFDPLGTVISLTVV